MGKFIFDGPTKTIEGDPLAVVNGVFAFDAVELYSEWVDWVATGDNAKYPPAFSTAGGDPLGAGVYLGKYIFMRNDLGWRGVPPDTGNVQVVITGNFYPTDENMPYFIPWPGVITVIQSRVSQMTQAIVTGGAAFTPADVAQATLAAAQATPIHANIQAGQESIASAVGNRVIEAGFSQDDILKLAAAVLLGRVTGATGNTIKFIGLDDETERVIANVDQNGNRQGVTLTP